MVCACVVGKTRWIEESKVSRKKQLRSVGRAGKEKGDARNNQKGGENNAKG